MDFSHFAFGEYVPTSIPLEERLKRPRPTLVSTAGETGVIKTCVYYPVVVLITLQLSYNCLLRFTDTVEDREDGTDSEWRSGCVFNLYSCETRDTFYILRKYCLYTHKSTGSDKT